jgi:hypothetical protein
MVGGDGAARGRHTKLLKRLPTLQLRTTKTRLKTVQAVPKVIVLAKQRQQQKGNTTIRL